MIEGLGHRQVWWADLDKVRPVVVLTRSGVAARLTRVVVAPVTTTVRDIAVEVPIGLAEGVQQGSVINCDNLQLVPADRLLRSAGIIADDRWGQVCRAVQHMMACTW